MCMTSSDNASSSKYHLNVDAVDISKSAAANGVKEYQNDAPGDSRASAERSDLTKASVCQPDAIITDAAPHSQQEDEIDERFTEN